MAWRRLGAYRYHVELSLWLQGSWLDIRVMAEDPDGQSSAAFVSDFQLFVKRD